MAESVRYEQKEIDVERALFNAELVLFRLPESDDPDRYGAVDNETTLLSRTNTLRRMVLPPGTAIELTKEQARGRLSRAP